ncbi:hypothetical protein T265_16005, partial [Opisthorchis viverrini]
VSAITRSKEDREYRRLTSRTKYHAARYKATNPAIVKSNMDDFSLQRNKHWDREWSKASFGTVSEFGVQKRGNG